MFKQMRRQDRELTQGEAADILANGSYGVLSVICGDSAYGVPLSYVYAGDRIYFHCALEGQKLICIRNNNSVTFCVVGKANTLPEKFSVEYTSAIAFGDVSEVHDKEKTMALLAFIEKYSSNYIAEGKQYIESAQDKTAVLKLNIQSISGKARK